MKTGLIVQGSENLFNSIYFRLSVLSSEAVATLALLFSLLTIVQCDADVIFANDHFYAFGLDSQAVIIHVDVFDNFNGDFNKYLWQYTVINNSYDPNPGSSNGFSGFETALPAGVPDLQDISAPNANWEFNCCSGQPVEWDIRNSAGLGVMPGQQGIFAFTSLPRTITNSTGWFHTWQSDSQTDLVFFDADNGVEVPLVATAVPEPGTGVFFLTAIVGFSGRLYSRRKMTCSLK
jgi:hypothetical protein